MQLEELPEYLRDRVSSGREMGERLFWFPIGRIVEKLLRVLAELGQG